MVPEHRKKYDILFQFSQPTKVEKAKSENTTIEEQQT